MIKSIFIAILFLLTGCSNSPKRTQLPTVPVSNKNDNVDSNDINRSNVKKDSVGIFTLIKLFPFIKDSIYFIDELKRIEHLELCNLVDVSNLKQRLTYYKKVRIYGSDKDYILIEYDYGDGCEAGFPWKYQCIFTTDGKLVKLFAALQFHFIKIFPDKNPFFVTVISSARGNGGHEIYKISADTLQNVYDGYTNYQTQTYDACEDHAVYEPYELKLNIKDFNKDGFNDIVFTGKIVLTQGITKDSVWYDYKINGRDTINYSISNPFKKLPIKHVFLYNPVTGHFTESSKYSIKYSFE